MDDTLFADLTSQQLKAFAVMLGVERERRVLGDSVGSEVSDACLYRNAVSREAYEAGLASIPEEWWARFYAFYGRLQREIDAGPTLHEFARGKRGV